MCIEFETTFIHHSFKMFDFLTVVYGASKKTFFMMWWNRHWERKTNEWYMFPFYMELHWRLPFLTLQHTTYLWKIIYIFVHVYCFSVSLIIKSSNY